MKTTQPAIWVNSLPTLGFSYLHQSSMTFDMLMDSKELLQWYVDAGVDEAVGDEAVDYLRIQGKSDDATKDIQTISSLDPESRILNPSPPLHHTPSAAIATAHDLAQKATTLAELEATVRSFDGCALKKTASKTVFCDGNPEAKVMIIGEAPGAQEDIQGIPFCGPSGHLLDKMLAAIGLSRKDNVYISNTVFWRPPGNRQPSPEETAICLPFVEKHIALVKPALLLLSGGTATTTLLKKDASISRLRGRFYDYGNAFMDGTIPVIVTFHPSYLLRTPTQKRLAWNDLLMVKERLGGVK